MPRVLEALESSEWASVHVSDLGPLDGDTPENTHLEDEDDELDFENMDFGFDREDFEGLKKAIWEAKMEREELDGEDKSTAHEDGGGKGEASGTAVASELEEADDDDIRKVEQMMQKLQAVRDLSAGLPEEQKRRLAARAVGEVMRDL